MVAGVTSGPTAGPVPNAGGVPGGGSWNGSPVKARAPSAAAMPTSPSRERLRKRRRMLDMDGILPDRDRPIERYEACRAPSRRPLSGISRVLLPGGPDCARCVRGLVLSADGTGRDDMEKRAVGLAILVIGALLALPSRRAEAGDLTFGPGDGSERLQLDRPGGRWVYGLLHLGRGQREAVQHVRQRAVVRLHAGSPAG